MAASVRISALFDPTLDRVGFPLDHPYIERVYCSVIGPTSVLLLRRMGRLLDEHPDGASIDLVELSRSLGVGVREIDGDVGRNAPVRRTMERLVQFRMATWLQMERSAEGAILGEPRLGVHPKVPAVSRHRAEQLCEPVRTLHHRLLTAHLGTLVARAEGREVKEPALDRADVPPRPTPAIEQAESAVAARLRAFGTNGHETRGVNR